MDEPVGRMGLVLARPARKINLMVYIAGGARRRRAVSPTRPTVSADGFQKEECSQSPHDSNVLAPCAQWEGFTRRSSDETMKIIA